MSNPTPLSVLVFLCILICQGILLREVDAAKKSNVYIVYLGERDHDDLDLLTDSHHDMLAKVLGSKEQASKSMVYSYRHGLSGFAAELTKSQAKQLAELPEVIQVIPNTFHKVQTTRSWETLDLTSQSPHNLLHKTKEGDGIIIGVLDTGIWPESEAFHDEGMGPIPSRWKGGCVSGENFNATEACNRKLIGARWFVEGLQRELQWTYNATDGNDFLSARDGSSGHGTHVSSTVAGSYVANVSYKGLSRGTLRGGAPRARLAMYKVCWNDPDRKGTCSQADIIMGFDQAIHDGVDVISVSIGASSLPLRSDVDQSNGIGIGSLHAVAKGIPVICGAGNSGPTAQTVANTEPWIVTVAASTVDRSFPTPITLGNNVTVMGKAIFSGKETGFRDILFNAETLCENLPEFLNVSEPNLIEFTTGKVIFCFTENKEFDVLGAVMTVKDAHGAGLIIAKTHVDMIIPCMDNMPFVVEVNFEIGTKITLYAESTRNAVVNVSPSKTLVGKATPVKMAYFSSRGPNTVSPAILKPDITAPGANILAATTPFTDLGDNGFTMESGTSMATPHISGIVALLKVLHPDWSPAALKSALMTTALDTNQYGLPILSEGKPADAFDLGAGIANPNGAMYPGLVYDMGIEDYIHYLYAMGFRKAAISRMVGQPTICPAKKPSLLDVNLPSITIPSLKNSTTLTRTVTNVGPVNSVYKPVIKPPSGTTVSVTPNVLKFNANTSTISFKVTISPLYQLNTGYTFGSLTWTDRVHLVRSPISVKIEALDIC